VKEPNEDTSRRTY